MRVYPILLIQEDCSVKVHPSGSWCNLSFLHKGRGMRRSVV